MNAHASSLLHLHLVLLRLLDTLPPRDVTLESVLHASREGTLIPLLRHRFMDDPTFRHFDGILQLDVLEQDLDESVLAFHPRSSVYGFERSGLCFICAALTQSGFQARV